MTIRVTVLLLVLAFSCLVRRCAGAWWFVDKLTKCKVDSKGCKPSNMWKRIGSMCYTIKRLKENCIHLRDCYPDGFKKRCEGQGGKLASVKDEEVAKFLAEHTKSHAISIDGRCQEKDNANRRFLWNDNTLVDSAWFAEGEPSENKEECCLQMLKESKKFTNINCHKNKKYYEFACMKEPEG